LAARIGHLAAIQTKVTKVTEVTDPSIELVGFIGWGEDCQFKMKQLPGISETHAVVIRVAGQIRIETLGSAISVFNRSLNTALDSLEALAIGGSDKSNSMLAGPGQLTTDIETQSVIQTHFGSHDQPITTGGRVYLPSYDVFLTDKVGLYGSSSTSQSDPAGGVGGTGVSADQPDPEGGVGGTASNPPADQAAPAAGVGGTGIPADQAAPAAAGVGGTGVPADQAAPAAGVGGTASNPPADQAAYVVLPLSNYSLTRYEYDQRELISNQSIPCPALDDQKAFRWLIKGFVGSNADGAIKGYWVLEPKTPTGADGEGAPPTIDTTTKPQWVNNMMCMQTCANHIYEANKSRPDIALLFGNGLVHPTEKALMSQATHRRGIAFGTDIQLPTEFSFYVPPESRAGSAEGSAV